MDSRYRLFFERISSPNNVGKIIREHIDLSKFFDNAVFIKNDDKFNNILSDRNIINEERQPDLVRYNQPILDLVLNCVFGEQLTHNKILESLNKNWIYYNSYRDSVTAKSTPLYIFRIDFANKKSIERMFRFLDFRKFEQRKQLVDLFLNRCEGLDGLFTYFDKIAVICLDENRSNKQTVAHELTHYFQQVANVNIGADLKDVSECSSGGVPELQLTKSDVNYLFSRNEIIPHILVDMVKDFDKFYYCCFKDLCSRKQFIDGMIFNIEKHKNQIFYTDVGNMYVQLFDYNTKSLQYAACSCYLGLNWEFIKEQLIDHFN